MDIKKLEKRLDDYIELTGASFVAALLCFIIAFLDYWSETFLEIFNFHIYDKLLIAGLFFYLPHIYFIRGYLILKRN